VEVVTPLEDMLLKYEEAHPGQTDIDQVEWKAFWVKHQRYRTICIPCIAKRKEGERSAAIDGLAARDMHDEHSQWGPVYLSAASRAIIIAWHRKARERIYGRGGTYFQTLWQAAKHRFSRCYWLTY